MIVKVDEIPAKCAVRTSARRMRLVEEFLKSGYSFAEVKPDDEDKPRQLYNGILMAVRRGYQDRVQVFWRYGHVYLKRIDKETEEK